jgi:hypothetical protein
MTQLMFAQCVGGAARQDPDAIRSTYKVLVSAMSEECQ